MNYLTRIPLFTLLIVALFAGQASAVEALSRDELVDHCQYFMKDPDGKDGIFCVRYIQGFIDGAMATDERVTLNVADEYEGEETFTQRATRTRLSSRLVQYGSSYYAEFCLGDPVSLVEVVGVVVEDLSQDKTGGTVRSAREAVYQIIRRHYPCPR